MSDFERRLQERIGSHRQERAAAGASLFGASGTEMPPPDLGDAPFEDAIAAYDDWIEQRIRAWRGEETAVPETPELLLPALPTTGGSASGALPEPQAARSSHQGRMQPITRLEEMDAFVRYAFAFDEFLADLQIVFPPIEACATLENFAEALARAVPELRPSMPRWLNEARQHPAKHLPGSPLCAPAQHIAGKGTYLNLARLELNVRSAAPEYERLKAAVRAVAAERWGHGFIEQTTAWGSDICSPELGQIHLLRRLGVDPSPTNPITAAIAERESVLAESALFTSAGWAAWIGDYLAHRVRAPEGSEPPQGVSRLTLSQIWEALKRLSHLIPLETWAQILGAPILGLDRLYDSISETLRWLFMTTSWEGKMTNRYTRRMQRITLTLEPLAQQHLNFSLQRALSHITLNKVEAHLGPMLVPYAVLLAANLDFHEEESAERIHVWLEEDVWQNVDARLIMLTKLDRSVKHNVTTLMSTAVHVLGLTPLEGMRWT